MKKAPLSYSLPKNFSCERERKRISCPSPPKMAIDSTGRRGRRPLRTWTGRESRHNQPKNLVAYIFDPADNLRIRRGGRLDLPQSSSLLKNFSCEEEIWDAEGRRPLRTWTGRESRRNQSKNLVAYIFDPTDNLRIRRGRRPRRPAEHETRKNQLTLSENDSFRH